MLPQSPFTRAEALDVMREREWRTLSAEGLVREVVPGIFVDASLPDTLEHRLAVARLAVAPGVVVARRTAAWVHGQDLLDYRGFPATPQIETVTNERAKRPKNALMAAHFADDLLASDVMEIGGLRVTTPLRTVCDLARFTPRGDALVAMDAFLHKRMVDAEQVRKHLVRWKGRRGIRQAYATLDVADARSESGGESRMRLRVLDMGLPRPQLQIPVYDLHGRVRFWLDLGWPQWKLALEYDGEEFHPEERLAHDEARRKWIRDRGWTVEAFRRGDIFTASGHFEDAVTSLVRSARSTAGRALGA
jgi:hypothetical protein